MPDSHGLPGPAAAAAQLGYAFDTSAAGMALLDMEGRYVHVNDSLCRMPGRSRTELTGLFWHEVTHPDDVELGTSFASAALGDSPRPTLEMEKRYLTPEGNVVCAFVSISLVSPQGGTPTHLFLQAWDIGPRKEMEDALRRSENLYRALARNFPNGAVVVFDHDLRYILVDGAGLDEMGLSAEHLEGRTIWESFPAETCDELEAPYRVALKGTPSTFEVQYADRSYLVHVVPVRDEAGAIIAGLSTSQNVTSVKKGMEAEKRLATIVESSGDAIYSWDAAGIIQTWNPAASEMYGYESNEIVGKSIEAIIPPAHRGEEQDLLARAFRGERIDRYETSRLTKTGRIADVSLSLAPIRDDDGNVSLISVIARDIEERIYVEQAVRKSEHRYRSVIENIREVVFQTDPEGRWTFLNPAWTEITGFTVAKSVGRNLLDFIDPKDRERTAELFRRLVTGEREDCRWEFRLRTSQGGLRWIEAWVRPTTGFGGEVVGMAGTLTDVTDERRASEERHQLQEQLRQSQKMEAVGKLAGGIAHDFNNLLSIILNYGQFVLDEMGEDDPRRRDQKEIITAGERGAKLVSQLMSFSRKDIVTPSVVDLNQVISRMGAILHRTLGENIRLSTQLSGDLASVRVDVAQLEQTIVNLALNARDAMPSGGRLIIQSSNRTFDEDHAGRHDHMAPGEYVCLSLRDSGTGMSALVKDQIFEPFFTTKERGAGTGLGLATVYGIVKQWNGHIEVDSQPGEGTEVRVYWPASTAEPEESHPVSNRARPPSGGKILVTEDEAAVRELVRRILVRDGYEVIVAGSGEEAKAIIEVRSDIDLLLSDLIMPGMTGQDLAEWATGFRPDLKVVYMSGYTDEIIARHGLLDNDEILVQKPFSADDLLLQVKRVLGRPGAMAISRGPAG